MRLFTALDLPLGIVPQFEKLLGILKPEADIKWSPIDNLHITTKFIGEWPEDQLNSLDDGLGKLAFPELLDITLGGLGWFPNVHSPRVLWAGVEGGTSLFKLAAQTDAALASLGVAREQHPFSPHLTLARIKSAESLQRLRAKVEELQPAELGHFQADRFYLYHSKPTSSGSIYQKLHTYKLGKS